jgi:hypothetical protein
MHQSFLNKATKRCLEEKLLHTRLFDTGLETLLKTLLEFGEFPPCSPPSSPFPPPNLASFMFSGDDRDDVKDKDGDFGEDIALGL